MLKPHLIDFDDFFWVFMNLKGICRVLGWGRVQLGVTVTRLQGGYRGVKGTRWGFNRPQVLLVRLEPKAFGMFGSEQSEDPNKGDDVDSQPSYDSN